MVNLSQKNIVKVARETGFIKDNVEKVMRLVDILDFIFSSRFANLFALKGGTAINLFYLNLPRLSVDIDLDYLGQSKEQMIAEREDIREFLMGSMIQKGYAMSPASKNYFALDSLVLQYINNAGNRDNIKIEINFLDRTHILPYTLQPVTNIVANSKKEIKVLNIHEVFGSKVAALLGRCKPRDVYDLFGLLQSNLEFNKELFKKCTIFYNCIGGEANIDDMDLSVLDGLTPRDITRMLKPMLAKQDRFDYLAAIVKIKNFLSEIMNITEMEKQFVRQFREKNYQPELLFDDNEIIERIAAHPMALWRTRELN